MSMDTGLVLVTAPATEPVTLAEVKTRVRLGAYTLEPAPSAPTCALANPAVAGSVDNGAHLYRVTFVTAVGETEGGDLSDTVTVVDKTANGKVSLTNIPIGSALVTSRKLYRTVAAGSTYKLLATLSDNTTTTYTDNIADSSLGAGVPSSNTTIDTELTELLKTAREEVEAQTRRALITQTWKLALDRFPNWNAIRLPMPPLQSVTSITYVDDDGVTQTMSSTLYEVDTTSVLGQVVLADGESWPDTRVAMPNTVLITFVCGYGASSAVPERLRAAVKFLISEFYENRQAQVPATTAARNEHFDRLIAKFVAPDWTLSSYEREVAVC